LPLALRSRLTSLADAHAASLALQGIERDGQPRCVNLAPASLADGTLVAALRELLSERPRAARSLSLDIAEPAALDRFELLQTIGRELRPLGVRIGLEHAGERLAQIERLFEAGLDYVKLDASVTRGVSTEAKRADFVKTSVALLHGLSLPVYAEGVASEADLQTLWSCGIDGATGPWITEQRDMRAS
jgi:EAL domain-containing protein (putative c-di-GMP-specific phosphodiesterase class I)